jgi:hypothetical protein
MLLSWQRSRRMIIRVSRHATSSCSRGRGSQSRSCKCGSPAVLDRAVGADEMRVGRRVVVAGVQAEGKRLGRLTIEALSSPVVV